MGVISSLRLTIAGVFLLPVVYSNAQQKASMKIFTDKVKNTVSPNLHGIFFEEISHGGEGGLYAEMIQNRGFEESRIPPGSIVEDGMLNANPEKKPHYNLNGKASDWRMPWPVKTTMPYWKLSVGENAKINATISTDQPLTSATPQSALLKIDQLSGSGKDYFVNEGFWGMDVKKGESYLLNFYAKTNIDYYGPLTVVLLSSSGKEIAAFT
ncbi:MAG: hypothetical protein ACN4EP_12315, partial [Sediminibacterium sp.]